MFILVAWNIPHLHLRSHIVRRMVLDVWPKFGAGIITLSEVIRRGR